MPTHAEVLEALSELHTLAQRYHEFSENHGAFLDYIQARDEEELREYLEWSEPYVTKVDGGIEQISPVNFLRRVIVTRILNGDTVTEEEIQTIQERIEEKDAGYFSEFPQFLDAISAQKDRTRSAFANWNVFRILFYIDYYRRSDRVQALLRSIATFLQEQLHLDDCDYHLATFSFNQNYGTDRCWVALFPERRGDHKEAHQVFMQVEDAGYRYGLLSGSRIEDSLDETRTVAVDDFDLELAVDELRTLLPKFYEVNRALQAPSGQSQSVQETNQPRDLNVILHGPPGVGKTYYAQRRAVQIVDGVLPGDGSVAQRFRQLVRDRRVELVTFHPSYSYEEFVEGFRYDEDQRIPVLHDGVFKQLVNRAVNPHQKDEVREGARIWKVSLGAAGDEHVFDRSMEADEIAIGFIEGTDATGMSEDEIRSIFAEMGRESETNNIRTVNYLVNEMRDGDYVAVLKDQRTIRAIGTINGDCQYRSEYDSHRHTRPVKWLDREDHDIYEMNGGRYIGMPTIYRLKHIALQDFVDLLPGQQDDRPFVLIVDEINRGNLSRIFGELITLLEPDKRLGARNETTVRLPYSQQPFTVPQNLHIVGTMNTADRSIALLDVALRRRFRFEELMPDEGVIQKLLSAKLDSSEEGFELTADQIELVCHVFTILNRRITVLLDRDHQIGHSYFLDLYSLGDLHRVLYQNVFPLLQEYFYNNRETLTQLLGRYEPGEQRGFVQSMKSQFSAAFGSGTLLEDQTPWEIYRYKVGELEQALENTFGLA